MANLSVFDHLGPFWAHLDPFGPFALTSFMKIGCSELRKCQNQLTPPYFDQLSERHQPLSLDKTKAILSKKADKLQNSKKPFVSLKGNNAPPFGQKQTMSCRILSNISGYCPIRHFSCPWFHFTSLICESAKLFESLHSLAFRDILFAFYFL